MSLSVNCPNCGAEAVFRSAALPARVCDYCHSLLSRSDTGVMVVGKSAPLRRLAPPRRLYAGVMQTQELFWERVL